LEFLKRNIYLRIPIFGILEEKFFSRFSISGIPEEQKKIL